MKKITLAFAAIIFWMNGFGQVTFQKVIGGTGDGEEGNCAIQSNDGGYVMLGMACSFGPNCGVYLVKTDGNGNLLWTKTYGYIDSSDYAEGYSIKQTSDGGYIISGRYAGYLYLIKTDSNGDSLWTRTYGAAGGRARSVLQSQDGGFAAVGDRYNSHVGNSDIYLIKVDASGNLLWDKAFDLGANQVGCYWDNGFCIRQCEDQSYVIVSSYSDSTVYDINLMKTDSMGNLLWSKSYGGNNADIAYSLTLTSDGGYAIAGCSKSFGTGIDNDALLIKTDVNGNMLWAKLYSGSSEDRVLSVIETNDYGFVMAGYTTNAGNGNDVYLLRTDSNGNLVWTKALGGTGDQDSRSVCQTADGGYLVCGSSFGFVPGVLNLYVSKTDANGNSGCNESNPGCVVTNVFPSVVNMTPFVYSEGTSSFPYTVVGTGGTMTTVCFSTGIHEGYESENPLSFFPNPITDELRIENSELKIKEIEIYSSLGEKRLTLNLSPKERDFRLDVSFLPSGIYFITVTDQAGNKVTRKVVKM